MRLVDDDQVDLGVLVGLDMRGGLVGGHGDAARALPFAERPVPAAAVDDRDGQVAVLFDLAAPVGQHAGGTDDRKALAALVAQRHHHGDRLHGLAQTHLVAQQDALLMQGVFDAPLLIAAQRAAQSLAVKGLLPDGERQVLGQAVDGAVAAEHTRRKLLEDVGVADGILRKILPRLLRRRLQGGQGGTAARRLTVFALQLPGEIAVGVAHALLLLRGGKEPQDAAAGPAQRFTRLRDRLFAGFILTLKFTQPVGRFQIAADRGD